MEEEFEETEVFVEMGSVRSESDEEFEAAVDVLNCLGICNSVEENPKKKMKTEDNQTRMTDRQIIHKMYGCKHCRLKISTTEDLSIHQKIDAIFNKMQQTVHNYN